MTRRIDLRLILKEGRSDHEVLTLIAELARHDDIVNVTVDRYDRTHPSLGNVPRSVNVEAAAVTAEGGTSSPT